MKNLFSQYEMAKIELYDELRESLAQAYEDKDEIIFMSIASESDYLNTDNIENKTDSPSSEKNVSENEDQNDAIFNCSKCDKSFNKAKLLNQHLTSHDPLPFKCPHCIALHRKRQTF